MATQTDSADSVEEVEQGFVLSKKNCSRTARDRLTCRITVPEDVIYEEMRVAFESGNASMYPGLALCRIHLTCSMTTKLQIKNTSAALKQ
jgi:hypothetical protein